MKLYATLSSKEELENRLASDDKTKEKQCKTDNKLVGKQLAKLES